MEKAEEQLRKDEELIREGCRTAFVGTSRLLRMRGKGQATLLAENVAQRGACVDMTVLRAMTQADPVGDELLRGAGARRVETLLPPWEEAREDHRRFPYAMLLCEHVPDVLPPEDRRRVLRNVGSYVRKDAIAYVSFFGMGAMPSAERRRDHEDGYVSEYRGHEVFLKPWTPHRAVETLMRVWGGTATLEWSLYDEMVVRWNRDV